MAAVVRRVIFGVILGSVLSTVLLSDAGMSFNEGFLTAIAVLSWSVGSVYSARHHLERLNRLLTPALKVGLISFLSFGSGIWGFILLALYVAFAVTLGWIYGWLMLLRDVASYLSS